MKERQFRSISISKTVFWFYPEGDNILDQLDKVMSKKLVEPRHKMSRSQLPIKLQKATMITTNAWK